MMTRITLASSEIEGHGDHQVANRCTTSSEEVTGGPDHQGLRRTVGAGPT
jgi:hypothetical protein